MHPVTRRTSPNLSTTGQPRTHNLIHERDILRHPFLRHTLLFCFACAVNVSVDGVMTELPSSTVRVFTRCEFGFLTKTLCQRWYSFATTAERGSVFRSEGNLQCIVLVMRFRTDGGSRCTHTAALRIVGDVNWPTTFRFEVSSLSDLRVSRCFKVLLFLRGIPW